MAYTIKSKKPRISFSVKSGKQLVNAPLQVLRRGTINIRKKIMNKTEYIYSTRGSRRCRFCQELMTVEFRYNKPIIEKYMKTFKIHWSLDSINHVQNTKILKQLRLLDPSLIIYQYFDCRCF